MTELIYIDGSTGGGQILRSALSLSALTGRAFSIGQIRKRRSRPGLMRQHLTAVRAAAEICGAEVEGADIGATELTFRPGAVRPGEYRFSISGAGSACLVLQTVLPPLMVADAPSKLSFDGGTHNPLAPPYPYLDAVFFPVLERMGLRIERSLLRAGFYPAGGGQFRVSIHPEKRLTQLALAERGALKRLWAHALVANLPHHIGERELSSLRERLPIADSELQLRTPDADGPGNAILLCAEYEHANEMIVGFGEKHLRAERVAERAASAMRTYLDSAAPVGEHLADQLLIPFAMAGGGRFCTLTCSDHTLSNIAVIERFLPVRFKVEEEASQKVWIDVAEVSR